MCYKAITMGYIYYILLFYLLRLFELVGEAIIRTPSVLVNLIVLFIKSAVFLGWAATNILVIPLRSIRKLFPTYHRRRPEAAFFLGFTLAAVVILILGSFVLLLRELPDPHLLTKRSIPMTTKLYDRHEELLYEIYADENRTPVTLSDVPEHFKQATLAIEDKEFFQHKGISLPGIARAFHSIVVNKEMQGGSTITQQLVRSALLTQEVTLRRKVKEIFLSIWAERIYTKDEILEMYFNQVPYGGTAWGAESAAQLYFGKSIHDIDVAEGALLAGLPAAPSRFSPFGAHPELASIRQKEVLRRMVEDGYITPEEKEEAEGRKLEFKTPTIGIHAPHFVMYVKDVLSQRYGIHTVEQGGLHVKTTLDLSLQTTAQEIVTKEVESLKRLNVGNGAAVIVNPNNGEILAMVGSTDYFDTEREGNVNVALTLQQPGSTIKAVTYAAALQDNFTAATLLDDNPFTYQTPGAPSYSPVNYDGRFHGMVPLRYALGNSYNVAAVYTLSKIGVSRLIEQGTKMGISSWSDPSRYGLSLTLGGGEVTMLEMAQVYAVLANEGERVNLTPLLEVTDYQGRTLENNWFPQPERVVPREVAFILSDILADNNSRARAFGTSSQLYIPGQWVPVKTGTSNDKRDNWTIGYTKNFVVTVWVGNNDNSPMNQALTSGITGATPIWRRITDHMLSSYPSQPPTPPANVIASNCRGRDEYFIAGTEKNACAPIPKQTDDIAKPNGPFSVHAEEPRDNPVEESMRRLLEEARRRRENRRRN